MKLTTERERAIRGMARKLTMRAPEVYEDCCQEGRLALHLFQPAMMRGVTSRDAYVRKACWNKMADFMRKHLGQRKTFELSRRVHLGIPTYRDLALEDEFYAEDGIHHPQGARSAYPPGVHQQLPPVTLDLDDHLTCELLLGTLPSMEREFLEWCYGFRTPEGCTRPKPRLQDLADYLGCSESNIRYHRDRLIKELRERVTT